MDKTGLIVVTNKYVNTLQQYLCVSRPRRFGKSVALYMLAAYYSRGCDSEELFHGFQIEKAETFREHLNQYDVIFLNMQQFLIRAKMQEVTEYLEQAVMEEIREAYTGFTQEEVKELCGRYDMDFVQTGSWYDGYQFRRSGHIYNPRSVVMAMQNRAFSNYWTTTETYEALKIYMDMDFGGLRTDVVHMLGGGRVKVNTYSFRNDMRNLENRDDVLTLLIHLGYLGYDCEREEAFIPNKEIVREFENAMSVGGWTEVMRILKASERLLEGINYDKENKTHVCMIEKVVKEDWKCN